MMCAAVVGREERRRLNDAEERWGGGTCCAYEELMRVWVEICTGGIGGKVVAAGTGVGYYRILWRNEKVWGGATGRGRRTIFSI